MALELGVHGIRVSGVAPTFAPTEMTKGFLDSALFKGFQKMVPYGDVVAKEDISNAVIFLLTAEMITGHTLPIDGGSLAAPARAKL